MLCLAEVYLTIFLSPLAVEMHTFFPMQSNLCFNYGFYNWYCDFFLEYLKSIFSYQFRKKVLNISFLSPATFHTSEDCCVLFCMLCTASILPISLYVILTTRFRILSFAPCSSWKAKPKVCP